MDEFEIARRMSLRTLDTDADLRKTLERSSPLRAVLPSRRTVLGEPRAVTTSMTLLESRVPKFNVDEYMPCLPTPPSSKPATSSKPAASIDDSVIVDSLQCYIDRLEKENAELRKNKQNDSSGNLTYDDVRSQRMTVYLNHYSRLNIKLEGLFSDVDSFSSDAVIDCEREISEIEARIEALMRV